MDIYRCTSDTTDYMSECCSASADGHICELEGRCGDCKEMTSFIITE